MSESKFIIRFSKVDRNKYVYYSPVTAKNGVVECRCEYKQDNNKTVPFFFESPKLIAATGIISLDNKFYIDLVVPMSSDFLDWLLAEDEKNIEVTANNSEDWLGERTPVEEISQGYKTSLIFRSQDKDPILRVNIPNNRGKPGIEVFDNNKKLTTISEVVPGVEVACIMEKQPLRFYRDKFTGEYLIYKLKVCSTSQVVKLPPGYIFSEQSGGESEGEDGEEQSDEYDPLAVSGDESEGEDPLAVSGAESEGEDPLAVSGAESEGEDPLAVSGDEEQSVSEAEEQSDEYDPLAVSGDEERSEEGAESEEEDPLAVSGDEERSEEGAESEEEDPLAVSGDESEEEVDPLAVSGDESEEDEVDPLAVSGDESEEEVDPLAVSGDESEEEVDPLAVSGDEERSEEGAESEEEEADPLAVSGDESEPESVNLDNYPDSEFSLGEGGEDEEISESKTPASKFMSTELTESDLDLSEFEA